MNLKKSRSSATLPLSHNILANSISKSIHHDLRKQSLKKQITNSHKNLCDIRNSSKTVLLLRTKTTDENKQGKKIRNSEDIQSMGYCYETAETNIGTNDYQRLEDMCAETKRSDSVNGQTSDKISKMNLENKLQGLYQEIDNLEKQVTQLHKIIPTDSKKVKPHGPLLEEYNQILQGLKSYEQELVALNSHNAELSNRKLMLQEEEFSYKMRTDDLLAEQQYLQEIIDRYRTDYPNESSYVLATIEIQAQIKRLQLSLGQKKSQIIDLDRKLVEFTEATQFELDDKKMKKRVSEIRIKIMHELESVDKWASKKGIKKIQELLCLFLGERGMNKGWHVNDWGWEGVEGWICKKGVLSEWQEYVYTYRHNKLGYTEEIVGQYFTYLRKMELMVNNSKLQQNRKQIKQYRNQIQQMNMTVIKLNEQISQKNLELISVKQNLEKQYNSEALATIEHLHDQQILLSEGLQNRQGGVLDLPLIKSTLRSVKKQQEERMNVLQRSSTRLQYLSKMPMDTDTLFYLNESRGLEQKIQKLETQKKIIKRNIGTFEEKKILIENQINKIIDSWQQLDHKKSMLKVLYKELNQTNRQIDALKLGLFQSRKSKTKVSKRGFETGWLKLGKTMKLGESKNKITIGSNKQNRLLDLNRRETINRKQCKLINQDFISNIEQQIERTQTRKALTRKQSTKMMNPKLQSNRESLTAMLMSKLTK